MVASAWHEQHKQSGSLYPRPTHGICRLGIMDPSDVTDDGEVRARGLRIVCEATMKSRRSMGAVIVMLCALGVPAAWGQDAVNQLERNLELPLDRTGDGGRCGSGCRLSGNVRGPGGTGWRRGLRGLGGRRWTGAARRSAGRRRDRLDQRCADSQARRYGPRSAQAGGHANSCSRCAVGRPRNAWNSRSASARPRPRTR